MNSSSEIYIDQAESYYKQRIMVKSHVAFIAGFGGTIKDFCRKHLSLDLRRTDEDVKLVKTGFTKFLNDPTVEQQYLSLHMKSAIQKIASLKDVSEGVNRLSEVYSCFCCLMNCDDLDKYMRQSNISKLISLLEKAPVQQTFDDNLYDIICQYL